MVRVGFDKAMDLIRVDVFQVVVVDLHPGVFQDFFRWNSLFGLFMKQLLKEKTSGSAHVVRELQLFEPDGVVELLIVRAFEGELATK